MSASTAITPTFNAFEAMRSIGSEVDSAIGSLPPDRTEEDVDGVIMIMDFYLQMGVWTKDQRDRICAAARRQLLDHGRLA